MKNLMKSQFYNKWAETLKTLGHPLRLKIVKLLIEEEKCVLNIWSQLEMQQSVVSQHLAVLRKKGIVDCKRNGTMVKYFVKNKNIEEIVKLIERDNS